MRGEVLHYDESQGFGFIAGADGNRYTFARENLRRAFPVSKGALVEFRESAGQARDIFSIGGTAPASPTATPSITSTTSAPAAPPASSVPNPPHFGRFAVSGSPASDGTGLWDYFRAGMTSNYANFRGRARRKEYWGFVLFFFLALIAVSLLGVGLDFALGNMDQYQEMPIATIVLSVILVLAGVVPWIAISVRRQHDIGLSGWFYLLIFVPYFGNLIIFVFSLIPSQKHDNKWGPVPAGIPIPPTYSPAAMPGTS